MKTTQKILLCLSIILSLPLAADCPPPLCGPDKNPWDVFSFAAKLEHTEGHGVGYKKGYTSLDFMFVSSILEQNSLFPLIDVRGIGFDDGKRAANAGVGLRALTSDEAVIGAAVYYDFRQSHHELFDSVGRGFNQLGVSLEYLSACFDLRLNGYQPLGKKTWHYRQTFVNGELGSLIVIKKRSLSTIQMIDAEIGKTVATGDICRDSIAWSAYLAAGPYYFKEAHKGSSWGGRVRLLATFNRYYELEVRSTYDSIEKGAVQCRIGITLPLYPDFLKTKGRPAASETGLSGPLADRLTQPIVRSEIIPLSR